jgi:hypothetical protein
LRLDELFNDQWAGEAAGGSFFPERVPISAPGYPWLLGISYVLFGRSLLAIRIIQIALGLGSVVLAQRITRKAFGFSASLVSALLLALYWPLIVFEQRLLLLPLFLFLNLAALLSVIWSLDKESVYAWAVPGLLSGAAAIVYPVSTLWTLVLMVWMMFRSPRKRAFKNFSHLTAFALAFLVIVLPIIFTSHSHTGKWYLLRSHGGFNLFLGNNPEADGTMYARLGGKWDRMEAMPVKEAGIMDLIGQDRFYLAKVVGFIKDDPKAFIVLLAKKSALVLNRREIRATIDPEFHRRLFSALNLPMPGFGLILGLALVAMVLTVVSSRYRVPLAAGLAVLAGAGSIKLASSLKKIATMKRGDFSAPRAKPFLAPALFLMGLGISFLPVAPDQSPAEEWTYLGLAHYQAGDNGRAMYYYQKALASKPDYAMAMTEIAWLEYERGDLDSAVRWQMKAVAADPIGAYGHFNLGQYLWQKGRQEEALAELRLAVECKPLWDDALYMLAAREYDMGMPEPARGRLKTMLLVYPDLGRKVDPLLWKIEREISSVNKKSR